MFSPEEYLDMFRPIAAALNQLADDELSDQIAQASAKMAKKFMVAFTDQGFSHDEAFGLTKVAMQQTGVNRS